MKGVAPVLARAALMALATLASLTARAVYVGTFEGTPPDALFYGNVRIVISEGGTSTIGSGVLLQPKLDAKGNGAWLYVLTADHVVRGWNPGNVKIGFGQPANPNARVALIDNLVLGPKYGNTNDIVDLAMVNVHIDNWSGPGGLQQSFPFDPANFGQAGNGTVFAAGYGKRGKIEDDIKGSVVIQNNPDSVWDIGTNKVYSSIAKEVTTTAKRTNTTYRFLGDSAPLRMTRGGLFGGGWPPTYTDSYTLPGDSGGPTYQIDGDGNWRVVGIHSFSAFDAAAGVVRQDSLFTDVDVNSYRDWIDQTYKTMPTPEPATVAALATGLAAFLVRRRRR